MQQFEVLHGCIFIAKGRVLTSLVDNYAHVAIA